MLLASNHDLEAYMPFNFPPAPSIEGLTYLRVKPVFVADRQTGRRIVFPVYFYRDVTGELVTVAEDTYEPYHEKLLQAGAFGPVSKRT